MEQQVRNAYSGAGVMPLLPEIPDPLAIGSGEHVLVGRFAAHASLKGFIDGFGFGNLTASRFFVAPGSNLMVRFQQINLPDFHAEQFTDPPAVGVAPPACCRFSAAVATSRDPHFSPLRYATSL
jgi:hypothetical protein